MPKEQMEPLSAIICFLLSVMVLLIILFTADKDVDDDSDIFIDSELDPVIGEIWVDERDTGNPFLSKYNKIIIRDVQNGYVLYDEGIHLGMSFPIIGFKDIHNKWTGGSTNEN